MVRELYHYGIKGMKWGVRNSETLARYKRDKHRVVFISGSSKTQDENSNFYRKELPVPIKKNLDEYIRDGAKILVGDAPGIDRQVQNYLKSKKYKNVNVFGPGKDVRYIADKNWKRRTVNVPNSSEYSAEWLAGKDLLMSKLATEGLAIVLPDGGAKATRKNVERLIANNKDVKVYELNELEDLDRWTR